MLTAKRSENQVGMGLGRVFTVEGVDFPKPVKTPRQTVFPPFPSACPPLFWFLFWFGRWFDPNSNDVTQAD
jgi:hypothetical protein